MKDYFDPNWMKRQIALAFVKKRNRKPSQEKKKSALDELSTLQAMKEDPAEQQKKMARENFEKK